MKITPLRAAALAVLLALLLLVPQPDHGRVLGAVSDLLHAPVFAVFAAVLLKVVGRRRSASSFWAGLAALAIASGFGAATEALQGLVGRQPGWQDLAADVLGALAGVLWAQRARASSAAARGSWASAVVLLLAVASVAPTLVITDACLQRLEMPQLASFEHALEMSRWTAGECRLRRVSEHATHGEQSLRIELHRGVYPGVSLESPVADWSQYEELAFDVELAAGPPLDLIVKIEDQQHNGEYEDRFHRRVRLQPGSQEVWIALSEVAAAPEKREMNLRRIRRLQMFAIRPEAARTLYLDNVRLE